MVRKMQKTRDGTTALFDLSCTHEIIPNERVWVVHNVTEDVADALIEAADFYLKNHPPAGAKRSKVGVGAINARSRHWYWLEEHKKWGKRLLGIIHGGQCLGFILPNLEQIVVDLTCIVYPIAEEEVEKETCTVGDLKPGDEFEVVKSIEGVQYMGMFHLTKKWAYNHRVCVRVPSKEPCLLQPSLPCRRLPGKEPNK